VISERQEWLEADGLGGFASGTATGIRTRRYHALLLAAATPPTGRNVLVAGLDAEVQSGEQVFAISSQRYGPAVVSPDGVSRLDRFEPEPWPRWTFRLENGALIEQTLFVPKGLPVTVLRWRLVTGAASSGLRLRVRPFLAGRDYHATHHENGAFRFDPDVEGSLRRWRPYEGVPAILTASNGRYEHRPDWYRNFEYAEERARGLDSTEDLACPGVFEWDFGSGDAVLILAADTPEAAGALRSDAPTRVADRLEASERRRRAAFPDRLARSADAYVAVRGSGSTIIAGYPWFTDWGRDTFIALRGLCLATGRLREARQILLAWADAVSEGMLPNRFSDAGEAPEFNAVDASLWFVVAAHELLELDPSVPARDRRTLRRAIDAILTGYLNGTRFGIRADADGLLGAGVPGVQLTWMDAKVGDHVITPRIGKPVEVQALWINALWIGAQDVRQWKGPFARAFEAFQARFWNDTAGALYDVVDNGHVPGAIDPAFRPNQVLAIGGLPLQIVEGDRARRIVDIVEARLWTPLGLRSLAPGEPAYRGRYAGGVQERDGAYHQGTVWPWLMGPFVEAWVRVRGGSASARADARARFLDPLLEHLDVAGLGHLPEVADGDAPHAPGGCPFQAWSLGEALRLDRLVLATAETARRETGAVPEHRTAVARHP
jgi:predicted glycogen debranching enzyme